MLIFFYLYYCMKCCLEGVCIFVCVQKINDVIMKEYLDRVFGVILINIELENLQLGIGEYKNFRLLQLLCCDDFIIVIIIFGIIKCFIL